MISKYSDRSILNGKHLKIGMNYPMDCISFSTNEDNPSDFNKLNSGRDYYLVKFLANHYNYTYEVVNGHFQYGNVVNGSIDGVCGMAHRSVSSSK